MRTLALLAVLSLEATNAALSWEADLYSGDLPDGIDAFVVDPVRPNVLLAARQYLGIYELNLDSPTGWGPSLGCPPFSYELFAMAVLGNEVFMGGRMTADDNGVSYKHILYRDDQLVYHPLVDATIQTNDNGLDGWVLAMKTCPGPTGDMQLYVGGKFVSPSGSSLVLNGLGRFDPATKTWHEVGGGVGSGTGEVYSIECGPSNGAVYVAGLFATVGPSALAYKNLALWTGSAWVRVTDSSTSELDNKVESISLDAVNGGLAIGGRFTNAGSTVLNNVAYFSFTQAPSTSITAVGYVAGTFTALLDSTSTAGTNGRVVTVFVHPTGDIYIGGDFRSTKGTVDARYVLRYARSTSQLTVLEHAASGLNGLDYYPMAFFMIPSGVYANQMIMGGWFYSYNGATEWPGSVAIYNVAARSWVQPGAASQLTSGGGVVQRNTPVTALAEDAARDTIYIAGNYMTQVGPVTSLSLPWKFNYVTRQHASMGAGILYSEINAMVFHSASDTLFVGGNMQNVVDYCQNLQTIDVITDTVGCVKDASGNDINIVGIVRALSIFGGKLYIGGDVKEAVTATGSSFAAVGLMSFDLTSKTFARLPDALRGNSVGGSVHSLVMTPSGHLVVGGIFESVAAIPAFGLLSWDGTKFDPVLDTNGALPLGSDKMQVRALYQLGTKVHIGYRGVSSAAAGTSGGYAVWDTVANTFAAGYVENGVGGFKGRVNAIIDDGAGGVLLGFGNGGQADVGSGKTAFSSVSRIKADGTFDGSNGVGTPVPRYPNGDTLSFVNFNGLIMVGGSATELYNYQGQGGQIAVNSAIFSWTGTELINAPFMNSYQTNFFNFGTVNALLVFNGKLTAVGTFQGIGSDNIRYVASHSGVTGESWQNVYGATSNAGVDAPLDAAFIDGTDLFVAGAALTTAGTASAAGIAVFSSVTNEWSGLEDADGVSNGVTFNSGGKIRAITKHNGEYYFGGQGMASAGATQFAVSQAVVKYNPTTKVFSALGLGLDSKADVHCFLTLNNKLILGGEIFWAPTVAANNIAQYDGSEWHGLSTSGSVRSVYAHALQGVDGPVHAVAMDTTNNQVVLGGDFATIHSASGSVTASNVAMVDLAGGNALHPYPFNGGTGVQGGVVKSIIVESTGVMLAGSFKEQAGGEGLQLNGLAMLTPSTAAWLPVAVPCSDTMPGVSGGNDASVETMIHLADDSVFIGGVDFIRAGKTLSSNIAQLSTWTDAVSAVNPCAPPTPSPSASPSVSPTPSTSASSSVTPSGTPSPSLSSSPSSSPSVTPSTSASSSPSSSVSAAASASPSPSTSGTPSPSASASAALGASGGGGGNNIGSGSSGTADLEGGAVAGIVIAVLVAAAALVGFLLWSRKREKQTEQSISKKHMVPAATSSASGAGDASTFSVGNPMAAPAQIVVSTDEPDAAVSPKKRAGFRSVPVMQTV